MQIERLGPYRIGPRLGKGGMGSVYQAIDANTGQRVAVKALTPQLAAAEGFRERFESEIESLKKLQHEGIVRLYGYGEDNGILFYSMELVDGPSLEQELNAGRRFDWNETLSMAIQVCRVLKHAHDHGIVHRDIKPANLLLTEDQRVKIADFGIARLFGATQLTTAGGILGTADYMSPEQVDGRPVTERCDQYSLGCVMFALLAGRPPFRAKTMPEMLQLQRFAEPEPVRRFAPQTPEQLNQLIAQLLNKDPGARFPNALVLSRHMEAMQKGLSRHPKSTDAHSSPTPARPFDSDATSAPATDATLAQPVGELERLETTDSDVYDAPTLADEVQAPRRVGATASSGVRPASTVAPVATAGKPEPPLGETRFTIVDETKRGARSEWAERWATGLQLAGLTAALAALGWLGWQLTRPASADSLYAEMVESLAEAEGDVREIDDEVAEFLERFPSDPRAAEVRGYAGELELQNLERRLRSQARITGGKASNPAEQIYADAIALVETDPVRAEQMMTDLLALYPAASDADESVRPYLILAERQSARLREKLDRQARDQLPQLADRLRTARGLEAAHPDQAERMYEALVHLYDDQPWAAAVVGEAKDRLRQLRRHAE